MKKLKNKNQTSGNDMSKKSNESEDSEVFLLSFIGEMVQVLTDFTIVASSVKDSMDGDMNVQESNSPLIVEGYLLDSDENYIYLGRSSNHITQAIKKDRIVFMQVLDAQDDLSEIIEGLSGKSKRDMN